MTNAKLAAKLYGELLKYLEENQFTDWSGGDADSTHWGICRRCGRADWEGHKEGCAIADLLKRARVLTKT